MRKAPPAVAAISILPLLALAGCAEPPADRRAGSSEDGSEVASSVDRPRSLELVDEGDLTPAGERAYRPDVSVVGGHLWLAYNVGDRGFHLQRLGSGLEPLGAETALFSGSGMATDIRVGLAGESFWYAFETVLLPPALDCEHNLLNAAVYDADGTLRESATAIARGCPMTVEFMESPPEDLPASPEVVDDPTPFFRDGRRIVLTRGWPGRGSTVQHLRVLDEGLGVAERLTLDTGEVVAGRQMSQSVLVHVRGEPYLLAGFFDGPPMPPFVSALYALPLGGDLRSFAGPAVELETPGATYPQRITRARHVEGTLILNYVDRYSELPTRELLALYDVDAGFALLDQIEVQDHEVADNHSSFDVIDDRLYLFQQGDGERLLARVFRLVQ